MKKNSSRFISWLGALALAGCVLVSPTHLQALSDSPRIFTDTHLNQVVIWETFNSNTSNYEIRSAVFNGSSWQVFANPISPSTNSQSPVLVGDFASGNAIAIWNGVDPTTSNSAVQVALYDASNGAWLPALTISSSAENASSDYQATIGGSGLACVTWSSFNNTDEVIYTSTVDFNNSIIRTQVYP